jgi:hypothetical protein
LFEHQHLMAATEPTAVNVVSAATGLISLATDRLAPKKTSAPAWVSAWALGSHSAEVKLEMPILERGGRFLCALVFADSKRDEPALGMKDQVGVGKTSVPPAHWRRTAQF